MKANSFSRKTGIPISSAASGSSRSDRQARPVRESSSEVEPRSRRRTRRARRRSSRGPTWIVQPEGVEVVDAGDPVRAAGEVDRGVEARRRDPVGVRDERDERLAEEERDDREVVPESRRDGRPSSIPSSAEATTITGIARDRRPVQVELVGREDRVARRRRSRRTRRSRGRAGRPSRRRRSARARAARRSAC